MDERSTGEHVKARQIHHWNQAAHGWAAWFDWTEQNFRPLTDWLRGAAGWRPGARVLDVACGPGYPALSAARAIQPGGTVVATDIAQGMLAEAARRAAARRLDNIEFVEADAEQLTFDDDTFDAVTNVYGLMFCPDPTRAITEARRVLKPGGTCACVTWDDPARSPYFSVIGEVAAHYLSLPAPDPLAPGPFRFAAPGMLESTLTAGGFPDSRIESRTLVFELESAVEYLQIFTDYAWRSRVTSLSAERRTAFLQAVVNASQPFFDDGRLRLTATSWCALARKDSPGAARTL